MFQEQFNPPHRTYAAVPIGVPAMVWNVGQIMFELMEQDNVDKVTNKPVFKHSAVFKNRRRRYYPELGELVQRCVRLKPAERPHLNALLYATRMGLEDWQNANVDISGAIVDESFTWSWKEKDFTIGARVPDHWGWRKKRPAEEAVGGDTDGHDDGGHDDPGAGNRTNKDAGGKSGGGACNKNKINAGNDNTKDAGTKTNDRGGNRNIDGKGRYELRRLKKRKSNE